MTSYEAALTALMPKVRQWAYKLTRDHDRAEDLLQDTLCKALAKRNLFRDDRSLRGWVFKIAYNLFITECRRVACYKAALDHPQPLHERPNQEDRLVLRDAHRALDRLPVAQKRLILLFASGISRMTMPLACCRSLPER